MSDVIGRQRPTISALGVADWLGLAAAPCFAVMALLTAVFGSGPAVMVCGGAQAPLALGGMVPMYLLMSAVHLAPWLKLRRSGRRSR